MRQEVYEKFASALMQKKADDRREYVRGRLADTVAGVMMQKEARFGRIGRIGPALSRLASLFRSRMGRSFNSRLFEADTLAGRLARFARRTQLALSPEVNTEGWSRLDPRRLFVTTRNTRSTARNVRTSPAAPAGGGGGAYSGGAYSGGAYSGGGGGAPRPYSELSVLGGTGETTRLSPGKILAALGITGGLGAMASRGGNDVPTPKPAFAPVDIPALLADSVGPKPEALAGLTAPSTPVAHDTQQAAADPTAAVLRALVEKIREHPVASTAVAGGTAALGAGTAGYIAGTDDSGRKRKKRG